MSDVIVIEAIERFDSHAMYGDSSYRSFRVEIPADREDIAAVIAGLLADQFPQLEIKGA